MKAQPADKAVSASRKRKDFGFEETVKTRRVPTSAGSSKFRRVYPPYQPTGRRRRRKPAEAVAERPIKVKPRLIMFEPKIEPVDEFIPKPEPKSPINKAMLPIFLRETRRTPTTWRYSMPENWPPWLPKATNITLGKIPEISPEMREWWKLWWGVPEGAEFWWQPSAAQNVTRDPISQFQGIKELLWVWYYITGDEAGMEYLKGLGGVRIGKWESKEEIDERAAAYEESQEYQDELLREEYRKQAKTGIWNESKVRQYYRGLWQEWEDVFPRAVITTRRRYVFRTG
jgi:hypothetical protein